MKYSGIGGQAVMEGVMMRNNDKYAIAVRKPDQTIEVKTEEYKAAAKTKVFRRIPIIRGIFSFVDSLYLGMSTLMFSASFFEDEEETGTGALQNRTGKAERTDSPEETDGPERTDSPEGTDITIESDRVESKPELSEEERLKLEKKRKREDDLFMTGTVIFSVLMAVLIFFMLPYGLSCLLQLTPLPNMLIVLVEGVLRLAIFIIYIVLISFNEDIKRTFMYHGAEHKCINCIEHGLELNVENVRASSREHKRCGTSFMLIVMLISIVFFMFIQVDSRILRLVIRLLLIPVIAGVSFEFIRLAGRYDNAVVNILSKPGMWMQQLTTKEPDDDMIEVGIASVEAVFDWKTWQQENGL